MSNAFLDHHDSWKAKHTVTSYGFPMLKTKIGTIQFRVLDNVPTSRILHFNSIGNRPVICPTDGCLFCARGDEKTTQHYLNVVNRATDKVEVLVYSAAAAEEIGNLIREVAKSSNSKEFNHPQKYDIELTRTGTGKKDTRYTAKAIKQTFSPEAYTPFDLDDKLVAMSVEEQTKNQGKRDAPSASIAGRGLKSWKGDPPSSVTEVAEPKTVIEDDDKGVL